MSYALKKIKKSENPSLFRTANVVVKWRCEIRNVDMSASKDAVMHGVHGWHCVCGRWTKGEDEYHSPLIVEQREVFIQNKTLEVSFAE